MFEKLKKRESAAAKVMRLEAEAQALLVRLASAQHDNEVVRGQLTFWHEHSRTLENKVQALMREQMGILEAFRAGVPGEAEYLDLIRKSREVFDAAEGDRLGTAALIASIALAGAQQAEVIGELLPSLKPTIDRLTSEVKTRPKVQIVGATDSPRLR